MPKIKNVVTCSIVALASIFVLLGNSESALAKPPAHFGMSTGGSLLNMPKKELDDRLNDMKALGVTMVRVDFSWSVIQPEASHLYDYRFHDRVVRAAAAKDIKVLAVLAYTPAWARESKCVKKTPKLERYQQKCTPRDPGEFAHFGKEVAMRYGDAIAAYEIWNEPNLIGYLRSISRRGKLMVNPVAYANLVNLSTKAIHDVTPSSPVITGGLAPMFEPSPSKGMRQSDFLRQMLPHLTRDVAAIGIHPYSWPALPEKAADWNAFYTVDKGKPRHNLMAIVNEAGRQDLAFWATEYGAPTVGKVPPNTNPKLKRPDHVDEKTQAKIMHQGIELWQQKPGVGPMFIHSDGDSYLPEGKHQDGFGLRRRDGTLKPAYTILKDEFGK